MSTPCHFGPSGKKRKGLTKTSYRVKMAPTYMAEQNIVIEEPHASFLSNIIAIIGLIVLIVVVIWGLVHIFSLSKDWFATQFLGRTTGNAIQITVPADASTGSAFNVSWKYNSSDKGNYAFLYPCRAGVQLKAIGGGAIPCGAAYTVGSTTSLSIVPSLTGTSSVPLPFTIVFLPSATSSKQAQGSAALTLHTPSATPTLGSPTVTTLPKPETVTATPATTKPEITRPSTASAQPADISVRILAVGVIDPTTGTFINRAPVSTYDIVAVQFDIANVGGTATGSYHFSASLPTTNGYGYVSPTQASLAPGAHVMNTLRWTDMSPAGGTFSVSVGDADSNIGNNADSKWISGGYYPQY